MKNYLELLKEVRDAGVAKTDRTNTGTKSIFARQLRFDLNQGFPLLTTKSVHFHSVVHELLWFLKGDTNIAYLQKNGVRIWNEWADAQGELGPIYGKQWRNWAGIDQIAQVLQTLKTEPDSRRMLVSSWNVAELGQMALMPCHALFQFYVAEGRLSCQLYQRSADIFLGVPFNIASYSLLTHMMAAQADLALGEFVWSGGDIHLYNTHLDAANEQLSRQPRALPQLVLDKVGSIDAYRAEHIHLHNYEPYPAIRAPVAV